MVGAMGLKIMGVEVTFNGMTPVLYFMKLYELVRNLSMRGHTGGQTCRHTESHNYMHNYQ
jgi:hypothetical protein